MTTEYNQGSFDENTRKLDLNRCLEGFGWSALLITIGTLWLIPEDHVPQGSWLIAAGIIMLGLNAIRHIKRIRMSGFSLVVGRPETTYFLPPFKRLPNLFSEGHGLRRMAERGVDGIVPRWLGSYGVVAIFSSLVNQFGPILKF